MSPGKGVKDVSSKTRLSASASPYSVHHLLRRPPQVTEYQLDDPRWGLPPLRIAFLSDLHVCAPWCPLEFLARVVDQVNALTPDIILLGGDYLADRNLQWIARIASAHEIVHHLSRLSAPLGVHGIMGNHDWKGCDQTRASNHTRNSVLSAFAEAGLPLMRNSARPIPHGTGFWLVGTDSQRAIKLGHQAYKSFLDADTAFADVPADAPAIHLAHEPDYFHQGDPRAFLQLSGHTHGGQIKIYGRTPAVPSSYGSRYAYGYTQENENHLIVSCGIGFSGIPLRIGVPPEIVLLTVGK